MKCIIVIVRRAATSAAAVFALVGQSVASAFASITICWNLLLSVLLLRERLVPLDIIVASILITGTVLAVYFGSQGGQSGFLSLDNILTLLHQPAAYAGFSIFGAALVLFIAYTYAVERMRAAERIDVHSWWWRSTLFSRACVAGLFSGFVGFFSKAVVDIFASSTNNVGANLAQCVPRVGSAAARSQALPLPPRRSLSVCFSRSPPPRPQLGGVRLHRAARDQRGAAGHGAQHSAAAL
jgi:hypothetical protein